MAKVLLADDSVTIHKVVEIILTAKGFVLKAVADGDTALEAVRNFKPDVVLADIDMPGLTGYDLAEKIKRNPSTKDIPVILLAGAFETIDNTRAQKSGATSTLIKPFESEDLVGKIREVLSPEAISEVPEPSMVASGEVLEVEGLEAAEPESDEEFMELAEEPSEEPEMADFETFEESVAEAEEELTAVEAAEPVSEAEEELVAVEAAEPVSEAEEDLVAVESEEEAISEAEAELTAIEAAEDVISPDEAAFTAVEAPDEVVPEEAEEELTAVEAQPEGSPSMATVEEALSAEVIREALMKSLDEKISEALASIDLKSAIMEAITPTLSDAVEKVLWEIAPELTEKLAKETLTESMKDLKKELEQIVWETVPEIAENIISKEIKRIREES